MVKLLFEPDRPSVTRLFTRKIAPPLVFLSLWIIVSFAAAVLVQAERQPSLKLTAEEQAWIDRNSSKIVLLFNTEFPPIEFSSATGVFTGMGADVIAMVEKRLGVIFTKRPCADWNRHLSALESGECAIAPTIVATPERERYAFFTTPYATVPVVIITRKTLAGDLTLDYFAAGRVAVVSGYATESYARDRAHDRFEVVPVSNVPEGLRLVSFGHVDALLENLAVAAYFIDKEGVPNLRVAGVTDYAFAWSIGVSRQYPLLSSAIQKALDSISENEMETIRRRWISLDLPHGLTPETQRLLQVIAGFAALLLIGLAAISYVLKRRLNEKVANLKTAQQELLDQADRLKLATEATQAGIWDFYPARGKSYLSGQWLAMLGYPPSAREIPLDELKRFIHPQDRPAVDNVFEQYLAAAGRGRLEAELRLRKADGAWCWVLSNGRAVEWDKKGTVSRIIGLDINIQNIKENQERLAASEARFRALFQMAPIPMATLSLDGKVLDVNDRLTQVLGYIIDDVPTLEQWWRLAHPDPEYRGRMIAEWNSVFDHVSTSPAAFSLGEIRVTRKDGVELTMIINTNRIEEFIVASFFDITGRKQAEMEREKLQGQLLQSQKLEAIGILAGGVAHDFNNMMGAIIGFAELMLSEMGPENPFRENLGLIHDAARHSADLTRQLLAFARRQPIAPTVFDLNKSVEAILSMLHRLIGENIDLAWLPATSPCIVKLDSSQFDQVLTNLCVNARNAIADVGKITIETDLIPFDAAYCESHAGFIPGEYVMLAVSDNGCGMNKETMDHIFEPFFTTRGVGRGTGLGLATVYGIVRQNKGFINVYSEPGSGTTFRIYLPRHAEEEKTASVKTAGDMPDHHGETILIVEDDPIVLQMGTIMLQRLGYTALAAGTPSEAIRLAETHPSEIHLFITDLIMPEMNGRDLADRLQKIRPTIKHLFMSGYTANVIVHQGILDKGVNFIEKPFSLTDMAAKIREALGG